MRRFTSFSRSNIKNIIRRPIRTVATTATRATTGIQLEWECPRETIFNTLVGQQKRAYAPEIPATSLQECWNCKKDAGDVMMCKECGRLQDANVDVNFYDLLKIPQTFALDTSALTSRFRQLQTLVHPDKFSNKCSREQTNSADWSSFINKAYKILLVPIERAQYLLKLNGRSIPQDNSALNKEFLMEMMERNEKVAEAVTQQKLTKINERLTQEVKAKINTLSTKFEENDLDAAISVVVELKYLLSIQKTIKNKLQSLMGTLTNA